MPNHGVECSPESFDIVDDVEDDTEEDSYYQRTTLTCCETIWLCLVVSAGIAGYVYFRMNVLK